MNEPPDPRDPSGFASGSREIAAGAERAREHVRMELQQFRAGIEKLRAEASGDGSLLAVTAGAERVRDQVREEFEQLRAGIERSLRGFGDGRRSTDRRGLA